ncbi:MAG TPA: ABC transporter permease [Verrucomicrobiae bacterium]|nr:ABC transporter permease [Verrucomicrobiae bacterium]
MQRLLAIAWLTWKAALRFRLFLVIAVLLIAAVVGLPILIKDDGTARGFTQILLTYTLSVITSLLGLSTLWLSCGTLARDIEENQIQVVAVKPVARWQIWLGKWIGIMSLNAALLAISGASVYFLLQWRATKLPAPEQEVLRNEVLVARGSAREKSHAAEIAADTDRLLRERLAKTPVSGSDLAEVRKQISEQVKAEYQLVPPGYSRVWEVDLGAAKDELRGRPLQLRVKFNAADRKATFGAMWRAGVPQKTQLWQTPEPMSLAPDTFHEFEIPPNLFDENGILRIEFLNVNDTALIFPLDEGLEVLYREGGFGLNFARGLGIIFCWMALLAAIGLASASFLSFPVAAFFSLAVLTMALSSGTLANVVAEGTVMGTDEESGVVGHSVVDFLIVPVFRGALTIINLARGFSPVESLSTGRSITWGQLALAFGQIVVLLGGIVGLLGIWVFNRRELATAQGNQ